MAATTGTPAPAGRLVFVRSLLGPDIQLSRLTLGLDQYRYEGEWYQGRRHGSGSIFLPNGDGFVGTWKEGKINGPVEYRFSDDSQWANPDL